MIHFDTPLAHAKHYSGWTIDLPARLRQHASGSGARLLNACNEAGIGYAVARVWHFKSRPEARSKEARIKHRGKGRYCPLCSGLP